jgi:AraC-like DNA-binding protein
MIITHMAKRTRDSTSNPVAPDFFSPQVSQARRFFLELKPAPGKPLAVVSGGCELCNPDYTIRRTDFPFYSIEFVARGRGSITLAGTRHELVAGTLFAYGPGVGHEIVNDPTNPMFKYFLDFTGTEARAQLTTYGPAPGEVLQVLASGEIMRLFDDLIDNGLKATPFTARICVKILEQLGLKIAETRVPAGVVTTPAFATYQRCRQHAKTHYLRLTSLDLLAQECHVRPAYLCRLFQRFEHQSPYQYLVRLRMNHATTRLQDAGVLVKQVADELGYSDPFHFSRTFKSTFGVSPEAFRRLR